MDYFKLMKGKPFIALVLLNIHLTNGTVTSSGSGDKFFGERFILTFTITPSFSVSATVSQDGAPISSCIPSTCIPNAANNVTFTPSGTGIVVVFNPVSSSQQGNWQCQNSNGDISDYLFQPESPPSSGGDKEGTAGWIIGVAATASIVGVLLLSVGVVYVCKDRISLRDNSIQNINDETDIEKYVVMKKGETQNITDAISGLNHSDYGLWKHNEETLFNTTITNASIKDAGLYEYKINGRGMVKIQLIVLGTEDTVYVKTGKDTFLSIDTPAENATAKWTHNGKLLTSMEMRRTRIHIHNALPKDTGLYACTLAESRQSFKHQLIVIDDALISMMWANPDLKSYITTLSQ